MSCDHHLIGEHLVDYIEGRVDSALRIACEHALANCADCREAHAQALQFMRLAGEWEDEPVPAWQRARQVVRPVQRQPSWLSWGALVTSCCSLLLVVFQLEVSVDQGLHLSFGGDQRVARLQAAFEQRVQELEAEHARQLETELAAFTAAQGTANRLLLAEWMERSREERRTDLQFIMSSWESQRVQDRRRTEEQLNYLVRNQIESDQYLNELAQNIQLTDAGYGINAREDDPL